MKPGTRYITVNAVKETDADRRRDGTAFPLVAQRQMERNAAPRQGSTQKILTERGKIGLAFVATDGIPS